MVLVYNISTYISGEVTSGYIVPFAASYTVPYTVPHVVPYFYPSFINAVSIVNDIMAQYELGHVTQVEAPLANDDSVSSYLAGAARRAVSDDLAEAFLVTYQLARYNEKTAAAENCFRIFSKGTETPPEVLIFKHTFHTFFYFTLFVLIIFICCSH